MSSLTLEKLHTFHAKDREIFSKLVLKFLRPPAESLLVMATWFWLEDFGFKDIFSIIFSLSDPHIATIASEVVACFECLSSDNPPNDFNYIPLTARFMRKDISLQIIYKHRYSAITGIKNFLTTICSRIFSDILQRVLISSSSFPFVTRLKHHLIIPGFPHPTFGSINVMPEVVVGDNNPNNNVFLFSYSLWSWHANCSTTENERTLFLTFSRGYPVSRVEVKELFTNIYGENCVERVYMEEDIRKYPNTNENGNGHQQSLYARVVLDSVTTMDRILEDQNIRKLHIGGKHIWARKYKERF